MDNYTDIKKEGKKETVDKSPTRQTRTIEHL